jgi:hypothetical protein
VDHLILHYPHHKCGTVWFNNIFTGLSKKFGWKFQHCRPEDLDEDTILWTVAAEPTDLDFKRLRPFKGSHMVRDPRDLIISGYYYHLTCKEGHILKDGYQDKLNLLNKDEGILLDLKRSASRSAYIMYNWDYNNPNILEFKYEDLWENEDHWFRMLFNHYGFNEKQIEIGLEVVKENTFEKVKNKGHVRKGTPGQWKGALNKKHKIAILGSIYQIVIEKLGYEKDAGWALPL